jgi:hypothetical protein
MRKARQQRRVLDDQRQVCAAPTHRLEQCEQPQEHRLRICTLHSFGRRDAQQVRHQPVESLSRQRGKLGVARALTHPPQRQIRAHRAELGRQR